MVMALMVLLWPSALALCSNNIIDLKRKSVLSASPDALGAALGGSGRARLVWDVLRRGGDPLTEPPERLGRPARSALADAFGSPAYRMITRSVASCGTTKLLLELPRGDEVETVIIPNEDDGFSTLCVSSQVGCRQACSFCLTGTMGLRRSLDTEEILAQVHAAMGEIASERSMLPWLRNIVFMGMGEPADNLPNVEAALTSLVHPHGFALGKNHVCVSTVGPSPEHIVALEPLPARLAWSAHAADDALRKVLVPTTRHSMVELRDAWLQTLSARRDRGLMVEVTLIAGVNDGEAHADELCALLAPLPGKTRVNVIPYNPNAGLGARCGRSNDAGSSSRPPACSLSLSLPPSRPAADGRLNRVWTPVRRGGRALPAVAGGAGACLPRARVLP